MTEKKKAVEQQRPATPRGTTGDSKGENQQQDDCRCKEVSKKTPKELLRVMLSDFAFWKRK